ncbi:hypothetical protein ACWGJX_46435 [Streptomyces sp. NPDC054775]
MKKLNDLGRRLAAAIVSVMVISLGMVYSSDSAVLAAERSPATPSATASEAGKGLLSPHAGSGVGAFTNSCAKVSTTIAKLRKEGKKGGVGCFGGEDKSQADPAGTAKDAALPAGVPTNACGSNADGQWYGNRVIQCLIDPVIPYTYTDIETGAVLGTAKFALAQEIDLSTTSLQWTETDQLTLLEEEGKAVGLMATWNATCSSGCSPTVNEPWSPSTPMVVGETLKGAMSFTDAPGSIYDYADEEYSLAISQPNAVVTRSLNWGPAEVRCDSGVSISGSAGCVTPWYTPKLTISRGSYGSSADMINWAQNNLPGHWGLDGVGQPLHRLQSSTQQASNRSAICGTSKFTKDPNIPQDSCDEFPFAGTYESGALNGVDNGNSCAQVTAIQAGSTGILAVDWPTISTLGSPTLAESCVRGHIPGPLNSDAGSAYGNFVTAMRLADDDPFWLSVGA